MSATEEIFANLSALGFNNTSATALYNKIAQAIGIPIENTKTEIANSENIILNLITTKNYGKELYYVSAALAFQYGDDLIIDPITKNDVYAVIDPQKQIISQAAFEDPGSQLFLKVATTNGITGDLEPLTVEELAAFNDYILNFELPGLPLSVISAAADVLNFLGTITYYKTYNLTTLKENIVAAMATFRKSFVFNGTFYTQDLENYLKNNVPGIRSVYIYNSSIDGMPFGGTVALEAGYFNYIVGIDTNLTYAPV